MILPPPVLLECGFANVGRIYIVYLDKLKDNFLLGFGLAHLLECFVLFLGQDRQV